MKIFTLKNSYSKNNLLIFIYLKIISKNFKNKPDNLKYIIEDILKNEEFQKINLNNLHFYSDIITIKILSYFEKNLKSYDLIKNLLKNYPDKRHFLNIYLYQIITGINKFENYEDIILEDIKKNKATLTKNQLALYYIELANILSLRGKNVIALLYYEKGIEISKFIKNNYIKNYGRIWRALSLAEFNERSCVNKLFDILKECKYYKFNYLINLVSAFILLCSVIINYNLKKYTYVNILKNLDKNIYPSIYIHIKISSLKLFNLEIHEKKYILNEVINILIKCEGIKGRALLITNIIDENINFIEGTNYAKYLNWKEKYINPLVDDYEKVETFYFSNLSLRPKLKGCNPDICLGICCYEGVYLEKKEIESLKKIVSKNKNYFNFIPDNFIIYKNWNNLIKGSKIDIKYHKNSPSAPKHFNNTRCLFNVENGLCSLQKLATDTDKHPWKYKPRTCWMFPIMGYAFGLPLSPPKEEDQDPSYVDKSYPGYVKFLPCIKEYTDGKPWYKIYKHTIIYLNHLK
jgi:tetratricopeptide (TPR) repeat protein